jgi:hypothetical protein
MPPGSYIITAIMLAVLVAVSFPLTMGFSIILWYWLFATTACLLAFVGAFRIAAALQAPLWIGFAFASPGLVWAANHLYQMTSQLNLTASSAFNTANYLTLLAAAACALRFAETLSSPHMVFRAGHGILAVAALTASVNFIAFTTGSTFTRSAAYATAARTVNIAAILVKYGAFIAAATLITRRRDVERWTGIAITLVCAYMLYLAFRPLFVTDRFGQGDGLAFWLQPVIMLVGGAAVWRMGSVLRTQDADRRLMGGQHFPDGQPA